MVIHVVHYLFESLEICRWQNTSINQVSVIGFKSKIVHLDGGDTQLKDGCTLDGGCRPICTFSISN